MTQSVLSAQTDVMLLCFHQPPPPSEPQEESEEEKGLRRLFEQLAGAVRKTVSPAKPLLTSADHSESASLCNWVLQEMNTH